jgi:hypothetical protein
MWIRHWLLALTIAQAFGGVFFYSLANAAGRSDQRIEQLADDDGEHDETKSPQT